MLKATRHVRHGGPTHHRSSRGSGDGARVGNDGCAYAVRTSRCLDGCTVGTTRGRRRQPLRGQKTTCRGIGHAHTRTWCRLPTVTDTAARARFRGVGVDVPARTRPTNPTEECSYAALRGDLKALVAYVIRQRTSEQTARTEGNVRAPSAVCDLVIQPGNILSQDGITRRRRTAGRHLLKRMAARQTPLGDSARTPPSLQAAGVRAHRCRCDPLPLPELNATSAGLMMSNIPSTHGAPTQPNMGTADHPVHVCCHIPVTGVPR